MLKLSYAEVQKTVCTCYSKSTLKSPQIWIKSPFQSCSWWPHQWFRVYRRNRVFGAKCVDLKRQGLGKVVHKPPVCEDLKKCTKALILIWIIQKSFSFFNAVLLSPSKANLHQLNDTDISFNTNSNGACCMYKATDEKTGRWRRSRWKFDVCKNLVQIDMWFFRAVCK